MSQNANTGFNQLLDSFSDSDFTFFYKGSFRKDIVLELIDLIEYNTTGELSRKYSKRVSVLIAESIQNVEKYGNPDYFEDTAFIYAKRDYISIVTTNKITKSEARKLKEQIDAINTRDGDDLEAYFDDLIENRPMENQNSAGLGLIQMKRKSERNLVYSLEDAGSNLVKYKLGLNFPVVDGFDGNEEANLEEVVTISDVLTSLYKTDSGIYYKGKFSNKAMLPILKLLQNYLSSASSRFNLDSMQYHIIIEMIQNVSKHNFSPKDGKGAFLIRKGERGAFEVITSNVINEENQEELNGHLAHLLLMTEEQLIGYCNEKMKEKFEQGSTGAGIGLPNIIRYSSPGKLKYDFYRKTGKVFFYLETKFD